MNKDLLEFNRAQGKVPDLFYYQMNGKSAIENYTEQRDNFFNSLQDSEEPETVHFIFTSEVK